MIFEPAGGSDEALDGEKALDDFSLVGDLLASVEDSATKAAAHSVRAGRPADVQPSRGPSRSEDPARLVAAAWPDVVGDEVAANARPVHLQRGRLVVSTSSSAWAQTLQLMGDAIAARLAERLGSGVIEQVVFRHAGWEERPPAPVGPAPAGPAPASSQDGPDRQGASARGLCKTAGRGAAERGEAGFSREQMEALAAVERLDLPVELREKIVRSMRAAFVRGEQDFVR
ncbi:MAG: DUF721 domain-containing protein [Thermoleophilia bacterium]|nr:DUF721 domain-containing protein [Thermoleophilia bacterium]